jgi:hypothetical protein
MVSYLMKSQVKYFWYNRNLPFIRVINALQADVLLILEESVEFGLKAVESELGQNELNIATDEGSVACCRSVVAPVRVVHRPTSLAFMAHCASTRLKPASLSMSLFETLSVPTSERSYLAQITFTYDRMALLKDFVHTDQRLECLYFVIQDRLDTETRPE